MRTAICQDVAAPGSVGILKGIGAAPDSRLQCIAREVPGTEQSNK